MHYRLENERDIVPLARTLILSLREKKEKQGTLPVVGLIGELGAGKTALVKTLARELGAAEEITSPTFLIMRELELPSSAPADTLVHVDAYRLDSADELIRLGVTEKMEHGNSLVIVEWADRVRELIPSKSLMITISITGPTSRNVETHIA